jgi:hypothetical protein
MASLSSDGKMVFMIFVGAIITVVFLGTIANSVFLQTNTATTTNLSRTVPAAANTTFSPQLPGRQNTTTIVIINSTETFTANFSVNLTDANGNQGIFLFPKDAAVTETINGSAVNITYTYQPFGYLQDSGARSVAGLIVIFGALAILVFIVVVMVKFGSFGEMIRRMR